MPDALELPGVLRAVVPLVRGEGLARFRGRVVHELVALALRHLAGLHGHSAAGRLPRLAAVAGALDDLSEPPARLGRIQPVRIGGGAFHVIDLPAGEVRTADVPPGALSVRRQHERALSFANLSPYPAHSLPLSEVRRLSSAASAAVPARRDGPCERPSTQWAHAPATMAKGKRSMAHDGHSGRNAPAATPPRMTADSLHVSRRTSSRRARSAVSGPAWATVFQMDSTVTSSAAIASAWELLERPRGRTNDRALTSVMTRIAPPVRGREIPARESRTRRPTLASA